MTASLNLSLQGSLDQLRIVWQAGEALLESVPFSEDAEGTRYNILVAVQEMLTNVVRHAYGDDTSREIQVGFTVDENGFTVELRDQAEAFDPLAYDLEGIPNEEMPEEAGGYGILIVRTIMDEVHYERRDGWNCLSMTKHVGAGVGASSELATNG